MAVSASVKKEIRKLLDDAYSNIPTAADMAAVSKENASKKEDEDYKSYAKWQARLINHISTAIQNAANEGFYTLTIPRNDAKNEYVLPQLKGDSVPTTRRFLSALLYKDDLLRNEIVSCFSAADYGYIVEDSSDGIYIRWGSKK